MDIQYAESFKKNFQKKFHSLLDDMNGESDRAIVIIIGAYLDTKLEETLNQALVPSYSSNDHIFDGPNAPLGSFSNKIDFCYRLGLISAFMAKSLHLIRKIRNQFAHNIRGCSFDDQSVQSRILSLYNLHKYDQKDSRLAKFINESAKSRFILTATFLLGILEEVSCSLHSKTAKDPEDFFSLNTGE